MTNNNEIPKTRIDSKEIIPEDASNYKLIEKLIEPLIIKRWPNQKNRVTFTEKSLDNKPWTETSIKIIKRGLELSNNERIELLLVNMKKENWIVTSKANLIILIKWYKEIGTSYIVLLNEMFNWFDSKKPPIKLSPEEFKKLIPRIEENIEDYFLFEKEEKQKETLKVTNKRAQILKRAINF